MGVVPKHLDDPLAPVGQADPVDPPLEVLFDEMGVRMVVELIHLLNELRAQCLGQRALHPPADVAEPKGLERGVLHSTSLVQFRGDHFRHAEGGGSRARRFSIGSLRAAGRWPAAGSVFARSV